jgi:hypothetical protein
MFFPFTPSLHSKQEPATQAGLTASGHARVTGGTPAVPLSALHAAQIPAAVLQTGFGPVATQLVLLVHSTQRFVVVLHTGVAPVQSLPFPELHWTQAPVAILQAGAVVVGHAFVAAVPLSPSQATHAPASLQTGLSAAVHCALFRQPTHMFVATSQNGVAPPHWALSMQGTQRPFLHLGVAPPHWVSSTQLEVQT